MNSAASLSDTASELGKTFAGQLLQPADPGYDDARKVAGDLTLVPVHTFAGALRYLLTHGGSDTGK